MWKRKRREDSKSGRHIISSSRQLNRQQQADSWRWRRMLIKCQENGVKCLIECCATSRSTTYLLYTYKQIYSHPPPSLSLSFGLSVSLFANLWHGACGRQWVGGLCCFFGVRWVVDGDLRWPCRRRNCFLDWGNGNAGAMHSGVKRKTWKYMYIYIFLELQENIYKDNVTINVEFIWVYL